MQQSLPAALHLILLRSGLLSLLFYSPKPLACVELCVQCCFTLQMQVYHQVHEGDAMLQDCQVNGLSDMA